MKTRLSRWKKRATVLSGTLLFTSCLSFAQTPQTQILELWTTKAGSQNFFGKNATLTDATNNVYVAGATVNPAGDYDALLAKYNSTGSLLWIRQYAGSAGKDDAATALAFDPSGNIIISGSVVNTASDSSDIFTIKYNSSGTQQWLVTYSGGSGNDYGTSVTTDPSGNVYIGGTSYRGTSTYYDAVLIKYNSGGTQQFVNLYNYNNLQDGAFRVAYKSGKVGIACGSQNSTTDYRYAAVRYDATTGNLIAANVSSPYGLGFKMVYDATIDNQWNIYITGTALNGSFNTDCYTVKFDSTLVQQWASSYNGGSNLDDAAKELAVDASGNVFVTGFSKASGQGMNYVTVKYNSSGTQQWAVTYNNSPVNKDDEATAVALDPGGNPVVCGGSDNGSGYDYRTIKYDASNGTVKWQKTWNSAANKADLANDIAVDLAGAVIVTGQSGAGQTYEYVTAKYVEKSVTTPTSTEPHGTAFYFRENRGQLFSTDDQPLPEVRFYNYNDGSAEQLYYLDDYMSYVFTKLDTTINNPNDSIERIDMVHSGASATRKIFGLTDRSDYSSYIQERLAPDYVARVNHYDKLLYGNVYSGIDVIYSSNGRGLKYYYVIKPGANPASIQEKYTGAQSVYVDGNGSLVIDGMLGDVVYTQPEAWQIDANGNVVTLNWQPSYSVNSATASFTLGSYNTSEVLVIEIDKGSAQPAPSPNPNDNLDWATHYAGAYSGYANFTCVKADNQGGVVLSGHTNINGYPVSLGIFQGVFGGGYDGVFLKFDSVAVRQWATYVGGGSTEIKFNHDLDPAGNVLFCARAGANVAFSQLPGAYYDNTANGGWDWYLGKLSSDGQFLLWGTLFGGNSDDIPYDIKVMDNGNRLYVVGETFSNTFPVIYKPGAFNNDSGNCVIAEFNAALDTAWSCQFGGSPAWATAIDGDVNDAIMVVGYDQSLALTPPFPLVDPGSPAYFDTTIRYNAFILKFDANDTITWSTGFGGTGGEWMWDVVRISGGPTYMTGRVSNGGGLPLVHQPGDYYDPNIQGNSDGYIVKFDKDDSLIWATCYGENGDDHIFSACKDANNNIYLTGLTLSSNFNSAANFNSYQQNYAGSGDAFVVGINTANNVFWSTCFGGTYGETYDYECEISAYLDQKLYIAGGSASTAALFPWDYPTGGYIDTFKTSAANPSGYVARFSLSGIVGFGDNEPVSSDDDFVLFPNPSSGIYTVQLSNLQGENVEIIVYDLLGQVVMDRKKQKVFGTLQESLDLSACGNGIYLVTVNIGDKRFISKKAIKQ